MKVAVLGAGISGLAAAWQIQQLGQTPTVFEADDQPGGKIRTVMIDGYLLELGPNTIQHSAGDLATALDGLALGDSFQKAGAAGRNRFIFHRGQPEPLPLGPGALIKSPLLSAKAKLRLLREPFVSRGPEDESVAEFFERRLGREVLTNMIDPFVAGVYAGDPAQLAVAAAFPKLKALERESGSILRGGWARMRRSRKARNGPPASRSRQRGMFSFAGGLQVIPNALADRLGGQLCLSTPVSEVIPRGDGWLVNGEPFDALINTLPVPKWQVIAADLPPASTVEYVKMAVVHLAYPAEAVRGRTDGFGMLIPSQAGRKILGLLYNSSLFPGRAPESEHLFTVFMGGQRQTGPLPGTDDLLSIASAEVADLMQIQPGAAPTFGHVHVVAQAIPQYGFGHLAMLGQLDEFEAAHPTWAFAGNYRQGISVGDSFSSGVAAAQRIVDRMDAA